MDMGLSGLQHRLIRGLNIKGPSGSTEPETLFDLLAERQLLLAFSVKGNPR
jgi:hypothetical protein